MKIALLHYSAPPVVGGVESVLAHQANLMAEAGHTVRVIAARGDAWDGHIDFIRIPLVGSRHPAIQAVKVELDNGRVPPGFDELVREIMVQLQTATRGVDVLIAHNVCSLNKNLALTEALHRLNGSPNFPRLILWHHDLAWTTPRYRNELHHGFPWSLLRTDWPGVAQIVISSLRQNELAALLDIPLKRIRVIPNGMDIARFFKLETKTLEWIRHLNLLAATPFLLVPVRITPRKNLEMALRILADLKQKCPAAAMVVTGPLGAHNPANQDYLSRLLNLRAQLGLEKSAHFLAELSDSYLPDAIIADFYRLADALLLPSREEGFGIPLIESALSHRPVFCTDLPPLRALGLDDVSYFSPDEDPHQVAGLIADTLNNDPVYRFATRTRQQYTWEQIYQEKIAPLLAEDPHQFPDEGGSQ
ncbi:MAG: glycosyltransferase family 4 protein [Chloroflexi bacterium]|nr:glycosyltransferase family 4 protein [Chloroflexota bacterium]MBI3340346.1 glycosyltransferase family 4 protein [Chloroflexota bacterium]